MLQEIVIKFTASAAQLDDASESNLHSARTWARELGCEIEPKSARVDALGGDAFEAIVVCPDCEAAPRVVTSKLGAVVRCVRLVAAAPVPDAPVAVVEAFATAPTPLAPKPLPARVRGSKFEPAS